MAAIQRRLSSPVSVRYFQDVTTEEASEIGLTKEMLEKSVWWIDRNGRTYGAHLAAAQILLQGPLGLRLIGGAIKTFPVSKLASVCYGLVAGNRGSISRGLTGLTNLHKRLFRKG